MHKFVRQEVLRKSFAWVSVTLTFLRNACKELRRSPVMYIRS